MSAYILSNALVYLKDILPITAGVWATFRISPDLERGLDINTGGVNAFFVLKSSTQIERYLITAVWGVATIVKRGLEQDGITENANLKKSWGDGSVGYITVKPDDFIATDKLDKTAWLRDWFPINKTFYLDPATGNEVLKNISSGSTVPDTSLSEWIDASTGDVLRVPFSGIKSSLSPYNIVWNPNVIIGEALLANDIVSIQDIPASNETQIGWQNIGDVAGNTIVTLYGYSTGASGNQIKIRTDKVSATSNLAIRVVTTSGGVATTTLVDANATQSIAPASVTAGGELTITFPGSFSCGMRGTKIAIQLCQWTFASTVVSGTNYYKIGYGTGTKSSSINENLSLALTVSSVSSGWIITSTTNFTALRDINLVSLSGYTIPSGIPIQIKIDWVIVKSFTTTSSSTTLVIPWWLWVSSGRVVSVVHSYAGSNYYINISWATTNNNITVPIQSWANTTFNSINTTWYAEENITSNLLENRVLVKASEWLFSIRNRLSWLNQSAKSQGDISGDIIREWVVSGFSWLITASQYNVWNNWLITTSGTQKIGVALSSTELDINFR